SDVADSFVPLINNLSHTDRDKNLPLCPIALRIIGYTDDGITYGTQNHFLTDRIIIPKHVIPHDLSYDSHFSDLSFIRFIDKPSLKNIDIFNKFHIRMHRPNIEIQI